MGLEVTVLVLRCFYALVTVFGILGNTFVIISILRQRSLLKNNYNFLVLELAICDLGCLLVIFLKHTDMYFSEATRFISSLPVCVVLKICYVLHVSGIGIMLVISVIRYRATVHPFKPAISRSKLRVACVLMYTIIGLFAGYLTSMPKCFLEKNISIAYSRWFTVYEVLLFYIFPTIFLAVVYYKVCRALAKQSNYMKQVFSNPARQNVPSSAFMKQRYLRNRRIFLVCIISVLCYAVGNLPYTVRAILILSGEDYLLRRNYLCILYIVCIFRAGGSCSVNPLIYGILDKKLLACWKRRPTRKRTGR